VVPEPVHPRKDGPADGFPLFSPLPSLFQPGPHPPACAAPAGDRVIQISTSPPEER